MNQIQILGLLSLILAVIASVLCAARLGNWRHPVLLIGLLAVGLMPSSLARPQEPPRQPSHHSIGSLVNSYYERIKHEQATRGEMPGRADASYSGLDRNGSPRL